MSLKNKIFMKVAILTTLLISAICVASALFIVWEHRIYIQDDFQAQALVLAEETERLLLWNDLVSLRGHLKHVVRDHAIVEYAFVEKKGRPYVHTFPKGVPRSLLGRKEIAGNNLSVWEFQDAEGKVYYDVAAWAGKTNGVLHLGLRRDEIDRSLRPLLLMIAILGAATIFLGALLAALFSHWTTREVDQLTEALRKSKEKYHNIFEHANDAIFILDTSTFRCLEVNKNATQQLGYPQNELLKLSMKDISLNGDSFDEDILRRMRQGEVTIFENILKRQDGTELPVETSTRIIEYEDKPAIQSFVRNITERKRAEAAIREKEAQFRSLVNQAADAFFVHDLEGRIMDVNRRACESLGYTREELLALSVPDISLQYRRERVHKIWDTKVFGEPVTFESVHRRKDGTSFPVEVSIGSLQYAGGQDLVLALARDITERKQAEKALLNSNNDMERQVKVRTAELMGANEQLTHEIEERRRTEEELLSYQAQLRSLSSELLLTEERERRGIATDLHDRIGQSLAISKIKLGELQDSLSSSHLASLTNEVRSLLEQTIQDTRSLTFELSPPILYELGLEPAVEWFVEQIQERQGIPIKLNYDSQPKPLDERVRFLIFRATRELLLNVAKHSRARKAKVSITRKGDQLRVDVEDDGIGFEAANMVFHGGTSGGFGLFSIQERLYHLGGRLIIKSKAGKGTLATLVAPLRLEGETTERKVT